MLHPQLTQAIKDTQKRLLNEGKLPTEDKLDEYYATFRARFGPNVLRNLDGEALLTTMHDLRRENRNSLVYWLEFKNDDEFPTPIFGGIGGGSALKYGVYPNAATGRWTTRDQSNYPMEITLDEAIQIARRHRDQLLSGVALLESLSPNASDSDYASLQKAIDDAMPNAGFTAWGHKYLSLLFSDKLDDYHIASYQRYHLVRLLEPNIPAEREGRFIAAGRFVRIARELGMPLNHLTSILNTLNGRPYRYWRIVTDKLESDFIGIGWEELGDLSNLKHNNDSKKLLREQLRTVYPQATRAELRSILDFVTNIPPNDVIVAFEPRGRRAVGIGRVTGSYFFEPPTLPHRLPIQWLSTDEWQLPYEENFEGVADDVRLYVNQVEIERRMLEMKSVEIEGSQPNPVDVRVASNILIPLMGIPGRVQTILERKGQVILYGPPGTGKTHWAELTARELAARQVFSKTFNDLDEGERQQVIGGSQSYVQFCSFHPAYGYEDFIEGYRPQVVNDVMTFTRQNGIFKGLCERASKDPKNNYYLIIDEINRGDIPRIFGELLTVLEKDKRGKSILLPISGEGFSVPSNVFVVGTMNTADRSIALLDTALRRRFGFVELLPEPALLNKTVLAGIPLGAWLKELNERILKHVGRDARNLQIGHAYFLENGEPIREFAKFAHVIREDIIPLLEEYCYEDYSALQQILGSTLVDERNQLINQDLFKPGQEQELVKSLLQPTPSLTTLSSVTEVEMQDDNLEDSSGEEES